MDSISAEPLTLS